MPKKFIKKYLPNPEKFMQQKGLQFLGKRLHEPNLWHLNRQSVSIAFAIGLLVAWMPTFGQMAIAAVAAFYFKANLPIAVVLVWITNPVTMPIMFYFAYVLGLWTLGEPLPSEDFEFTLDGVISSLSGIGGPLLLGCLILGVISSVIGYYGIRLLWLYQVSKQWQQRKNK